jgi:histone deacetylase 1/2
LSDNVFIVIPAEIPDNDYLKYFKPDCTLKINTGNHMENLNGKTYLSTIKMQVMENLRRIAHSPSVQMHEVPPDTYFPEFDEDETNPDERMDRKFPPWNSAFMILQS